MECGFWNVNGLRANAETDNHKLRTTCILKLGLVIIGIAETHLKEEKNNVVPRYKWFGHNRQRAKSGSGGVGVK